jgi:hypothetical protein
MQDRRSEESFIAYKHERKKKRIYVHTFFFFVSHLFSVNYGKEPNFDTEYLDARPFLCSYVTPPGGVNFNTAVYVEMNARLSCLYRRSCVCALDSSRSLPSQWIQYVWCV